MTNKRTKARLRSIMNVTVCVSVLVAIVAEAHHVIYLPEWTQAQAFRAMWWAYMLPIPFLLAWVVFSDR